MLTPAQMRTRADDLESRSRREWNRAIEKAGPDGTDDDGAELAAIVAKTLAVRAKYLRALADDFERWPDAARKAAADAAIGRAAR